MTTKPQANSWKYGHEKVWDPFTQKWWCVCEDWTSDSFEAFEQHAVDVSPTPNTNQETK